MNEEINDEIYKFANRKKEIKMSVRVFFRELFVTTAGSQLEPSSGFANNRYFEFFKKVKLLLPGRLQ